MGGSALNWPENHYLELIHSLLREGRKVLVTGGPTEGAMLDRIRGALEAGHQDQKETAMFYGGPDIGEIDFLGGLYSWASVVVAPSTGPMHMAVALGRPVVTFYPPIRVQSAIRWGPYLRDESRATVMVPEVFCGEDFKCRGSLCNYYPCMRSLLVKEAHEHVNRQLDAPGEHEAEPAKAAVGEGATELKTEQLVLRDVGKRQAQVHPPRDLRQARAGYRRRGRGPLHDRLGRADLAGSAGADRALSKRRTLKLGLAANVADNLKTLGGDPGFVGVIGRDRAAADLTKLLSKARDLRRASRRRRKAADDSQGTHRERAPAAPARGLRER